MGVSYAPGHIRAIFPHAAQVFLIERYVTRKVRRRKKNSRKYKTVQVKTGGGGARRHQLV